MILICKRPAGEADLHDIVVEISDLGPAFTYLAAKDAWVIVASERGIAVIIDHDAVIAPQHHQRGGTMDDERDDRPQTLRPALKRSQRGCRPIEGGDTLSHFPAAGEELLDAGRADHVMLVHSAPRFAPSNTRDGPSLFHRRNAAHAAARPCHNGNGSSAHVLHAAILLHSSEAQQAIVARQDQRSILDLED